MATQLLFSDLMAAAAVVASSSAAGPTTTSTLSNSLLMDSSSSAAPYYSAQNTNNNGPSINSKGNYLEDQRALQLAFELSLLNNNGNGGESAPGPATNGSGSNASSMSSSSSLGLANGSSDMNPAFYLNATTVLQQHQHRRQQGTTCGGGNGIDNNGQDYENVLQHFLGSGSHEPVLNNLGSSVGQQYHQAQQQQTPYEDMILEKFLLNQNLGNNGGDTGSGSGEYFNHQQQQSGHHQLNHHNATLNNLMNGISSINLNNLNGSVHGYSNGSNSGHGGGNGGLMNENERFKKSQNMTECVPVPSSEHVAEIVGRQGKSIGHVRISGSRKYT